MGETLMNIEIGRIIIIFFTGVGSKWIKKSNKLNKINKQSIAHPHPLFCLILSSELLYTLTLMVVDDGCNMTWTKMKISLGLQGPAMFRIFIPPI